MAFEIIKNIVEAEKKADGIKAKAIAEAENIKAAAVVKSNEIAAMTKKQAKLQEETLIKKAIADSRDEVMNITAASEEKCKEIKSTAQKRMHKAINAVVGKVVDKDGNS